MSMQSALAALATTTTEAPNAPIIDSKGAPVVSQPSTVPPITPSASERLKEAVAPKVEGAKPASPKSDAFAALAKRERALQRQSADLKAKEAQYREWERLKASATSNPLEALKALGLSYEQITQFLLNGSKPTPELEVAQVKADLEKLRTEQAQREQNAKNEARRVAEREYQQTYVEFTEEIGSYLQDNRDAYELTNMYEGQNIVLATIEQHFANTKKIMSIKEAADLVEQYFEEQVANASKTKKFQAKQQPKVSEGQSRGEGVLKSSAPTLSNGLTTSAPSLLPAKTEQARMNRALAALDKQS
jgi:hypothetical protein